MNKIIYKMYNTYQLMNIFFKLHILVFPTNVNTRNMQDIKIVYI